MPMKSILSDVYLPENVDLWQFMQVKAADNLDTLALIDGVTEESLSYRDFLRDVNRLRNSLYQLGMRKGDVLLVYSTNNIRTPVVAAAVFSLGAVLTTCNPLYTKDELLYHLRDSGTKYVVTAPDFLSTLMQARQEYGHLREVIVYGGSGQAGQRAYAELLESGAPPAPSVAIKPDEDVACLPYSSGTTGRPKGVMLTHRNVLANWYLMHHPEIRTDTNAEGGAIVSFMPMYHIYGIALMFISLTVAKTLVCLARFELERYLQLVQRYRPNQLYLVPPVAILLSKHPLVDKYDLSCVQYVFSGAAPLGREVVEALHARLTNMRAVRQGYGLTELSPVSHTAPVYRNPAGCVGFLAPNSFCNVIDVDTGEELGCGKTGEICVKGPQVMKGYLNRPEATAATIDKDGYLHTGDIGYYDNDHYFFVTDRLKELIKYKGFQVAPATLEDLLQTHPAVADAAVLGLPDTEAGELPCACVVLKPGCEATQPQQIVDYVAGKVAPHMRLRGGVRFVAEIPRNPSGKILRRVLRQTALPAFKAAQAKAKL